MKRPIVIATLVFVAIGLLAFPIWSSGLRTMQLKRAIDASEPTGPATVRRLLDQGADIQTRGDSGQTVAFVAAFWNDAELLQRALDGGVDSNAVDLTFGNTALHHAMFAPNPEIARLLIAAGADVNHHNHRGETPLHGAVRNAQYEIIPLLIDAGAKVDVTNEAGETPLSLTQKLSHSSSYPMRPDLTSADFVKLLHPASPAP